MADFVVIDGFISLGGVDLSAFVTSFTVNYSSELQDTTAMGDNSRTRIGGLKDWSLEVEFNQDYEASAPDVTLFSLVGTSVAIILRAASGAKSATNPEYTGNAILETYPPIGGSVGDKAVTTASFQGNGDLARGV